jgi:NitT/TauT family transport system substrate-binding protein
MNHLDRSKALFLAAAAFAGTALVGCGDPGGSDGEVSTVRMQLNWLPEPQFGGIYAAEAEGIFRNANLRVEILKGGPGVPAPQMLASGQVEFAVISSDELLLINEQGGDLVALFAIYQSDPMSIMVHADAPWESLEALWRSDATVSCESNLPYVAFLNRRFGGERLRLVSYQSNLAAFVNDPRLAQQCFITSEPVTLELQGVRTRVFTLGASGYDPYRAVVAVRRGFLDRNTDLCTRLVLGLREGWRRYLQEPQGTNVVMTELNPAMSRAAMDLAAARQAPLIETELTRLNALGWMTAARWAEFAGQLHELGRLQRPPGDLGGVFWQPPVDGAATAALDGTD